MAEIEVEVTIGDCQWFAMCTNAPTGTTPHPILGDVPICPRCAKRFDLSITPFKEN